jgi:hypothetical protein
MGIVYRGTSDTGLKEVKNTAGMATPQAFIRKKCQSIIRCSLVVKASYNQPRDLSKGVQSSVFWEHRDAICQRVVRLVVLGDLVLTSFGERNSASERIVMENGW